jgi:hypothetical protein
MARERSLSGCGDPKRPVWLVRDFGQRAGDLTGSGGDLFFPLVARAGGRSAAAGGAATAGGATCLSGPDSRPF